MARTGPIARRLKRTMLDPLVGLAAHAVFAVARLLPLDTASDLGSRLARAVGPRLGLARIARRNLERAFPEKSAEEIETILDGMWDNLGRTFFEYPHLAAFELYGSGGGGRVEVIGTEHIDALRDDGRPGLCFSAHLANWEIISLAATQRGLPLDRVYRAPNNPYVERLFRGGRAAVRGELLRKGREGARRAVDILAHGGHVGMLVDQKMNEGIAVPFFGRPAMTAPALASFAHRYDCPVLPAHVQRLGGARFRVVVEPPIVVPRTGDRRADIAATMELVNRMIEGWIRERPAEWLWVHRRWRD